MRLKQAIAGAAADSGTSRFLGQEIAMTDRPELTAAKIIGSGGRAMGSTEKLRQVLVGAPKKAAAAGHRPVPAAYFWAARMAC
jgi:electron transfer flavoprotein alpha subunit